MSAPGFSPGLYGFCRGLLYAYLRVFHRMEVCGREHVPATGGCILASNHASFIDPPVVGCAARKRFVRFMARDTLFRKGFSKWLLLNIAAVPLSREKGDVGALKRAIQVLKDGDCLGLFPEGTRSRDGNLQEAKGGIGFLMAKAGVPVVPVYVDGTFAAYPRGAAFIRPAKIRVFIGPPIAAHELAAFGSDRESYSRIGQLVMDRIAALRPTA